MGEPLTLLKSLVVSLVLANVCYFLWQRGIAKAPENIVAPPPPGGLKLVSESPDFARGEPGPNTAIAPVPLASGGPAAPAENLLTNVKRCISVGPFRDVSEAAHAASTLRSGGYDPRQRVADGGGWGGGWVYLPLPASRAAGDQVLSKLKAGGIDDALEMPGPGDGSVISL